ncbi:helix-turn-helix domain-containing protein [Roseibium sp.]|uniref:helix-turn-helix domain-containing protein n=1 Tax=Roseibium sp. TaxID=1936156 RepID=UPI0039192AF8
MANDFVSNELARDVQENSQLLETLESFLHLPNWGKSDGLQLSAGPMKTSRNECDLGFLKIAVNTCNASVYDHGVYDGSNLVLNMVVGGREQARYRGPVDLDETIMVWRPGGEDDHQYVMPAEALDVVLELSPAYCEVMGWSVHDKLITGHGSQHLTDLVHKSLALLRTNPQDTAPYCDALTTSLSALFDHAGGDVDTGAHVDGAALKQTRPHDIFARAARLLDPDETVDPPISGADDLANKLGISRRSLFASFRKWPGLGPGRYQSLIRLHRLRKRLQAAHVSETTVTDEAFALGIAHLGRLSAEYRKQFGEYPSETLRREPYSCP